MSVRKGGDTVTQVYPRLTQEFRRTSLKGREFIFRMYENKAQTQFHIKMFTPSGRELLKAYRDSEDELSVTMNSWMQFIEVVDFLPRFAK